MNNRKLAVIDKEFEKTVRSMYPFARSLYHALGILNNKLKEELYYGEKNVRKKR